MSIEDFIRRKEAALAERWMRSVRSYARRVRYPRRLGMTHDDVVQDLTMIVIDLHRKWLHEQCSVPDEPLIRHALKWRVRKLNRDAATRMRTALDQDLVGGDLDRLPLIVGDPVEAQDREDMCATLFYSLRKVLRADQVALMYLRHGEGMTPVQIARLTNRDNKQVSKKLYEATKQAREFLASIGIHQWDDVLAARPEEVDHESIDPDR